MQTTIFVLRYVCLRALLEDKNWRSNLLSHSLRWLLLSKQNTFCVDVEPLYGHEYFKVYLVGFILMLITLYICKRQV